MSSLYLGLLINPLDEEGFDEEEFEEPEEEQAPAPYEYHRLSAPHIHAPGEVRAASVSPSVSSTSLVVYSSHQQHLVPHSPPLQASIRTHLQHSSNPGPNVSPSKGNSSPKVNPSPKENPPKANPSPKAQQSLKPNQVPSKVTPPKTNLSQDSNANRSNSKNTVSLRRNTVHGSVATTSPQLCLPTSSTFSSTSSSSARSSGTSATSPTSATAGKTSTCSVSSSTSFSLKAIGKLAHTGITSKASRTPGTSKSSASSSKTPSSSSSQSKVSKSVDKKTSCGASLISPGTSTSSSWTPFSSSSSHKSGNKGTLASAGTSSSACCNSISRSGSKGKTSGTSGTSAPISKSTLKGTETTSSPFTSYSHKSGLKDTETTSSSSPLSSQKSKLEEKETSGTSSSTFPSTSSSFENISQSAHPKSASPATLSSSDAPVATKSTHLTGVGTAKTGSKASHLKPASPTTPSSKAGTSGIGTPPSSLVSPTTSSRSDTPVATKSSHLTGALTGAESRSPPSARAPYVAIAHQSVVPDPCVTRLLARPHVTATPAASATMSKATATPRPEKLIFSGEYTKAMDQDWHSGHFCCWNCDLNLTGHRYILREEHPYCIKCYENLFANSCEECKTPIGTDSKDLSYKEKHWHEKCFKCVDCTNSLVDQPFSSREDKLYCADCHDNNFAARCDGCTNIFKAGMKKFEYKGKQWHEQCFCCSVCKQPIGNKSFIPRDQEVVCVPCYEENFAQRCLKCSGVINKGGITYKGAPWHKDCFTCTNCNKTLSGEKFTSREDKPYCADCFGELFAKKCIKCTKAITGLGGTKFISFEERHWHSDCFMCYRCNTSLVGRGFLTDGDDILCPECGRA